MITSDSQGGGWIKDGEELSTKPLWVFGLGGQRSDRV